MIYFMFQIETLFLSEQITGYRSGALAKIRDKFRTKLNEFSYVILQFRLNSFKNFITMRITLENVVAR